MSRPDCISNRNLKIISTYVFHKTGSIAGLFDGLKYPTSIYRKAEDYFLKEDEWTSLSNFYTVFKRAKDKVQEKDFCFKCGLSTAKLESWGKLHYFAKLFSSPSDGYRRIGFFNKQFNDTKELKLVIPPYYDKNKGLMRTVLIIEYHEDMNPNEDIMGDLYTRGILSAIPAVWNLPPANIECVMAPYDPIFVLSSTGLRPDFQWMGGRLFILDKGEEQELGELVELLPEDELGGYLLGRYRPASLEAQMRKDRPLALLLRRNLEVDELTIKKDSLVLGPYFVFEITYERMSIGNRLRSIMPSKGKREASQKALMETIEELRATVREKQRTYSELEKVNEELRQIRDAQERIIRERTLELEKAKEQLTLMNRMLTDEIEEKKEELKNVEFLKRYLSPTVIEYLRQKGQSDIPFQRRFVTIIFADIRDFSSISELNEPEDTMEMLNLYFNALIRLAHEYEGTIYKLLGDGAIIVFNDIKDIEDHPFKAVKLAWKIREVLRELNAKIHERLDVGMGINSGYVSLGTIGSPIFKDYAIVGKEMNLAARVQAVAGPDEIIITKRTFSLVKKRVEVEEKGEVHLKGITRPVLLYKVLGIKD